MKLLAAILLVICGASVSGLELSPGGGVEGFTNWGLGVRSEGMGRTLGAATGDATSLYWNPAGLYILPKGEVTLSSAALYANIHNIYVHSLSFGYPLRYTNSKGDPGSFGTIGLALGYYGAGEIWAADDRGLTGRTFTDSDIAFYLGYGKDLKKNLALGLALKSFDRKIDDYRDTAFGLDIGIDYKPFDLLNVSFVGRNLIAPTYQFEEIREGVDPAAEIGAGFAAFGYGDICGIFTIDRQGFYDARVGAEIRPFSMLAIRGGYILSDEQPRAGVGFKFADFDVDYTARLDDTLGITHMASVSFHFTGKTESTEEEWDENDDGDYIEWEEDDTGTGEGDSGIETPSPEPETDSGE
jgi:hypothetical protein